MNTPCTVPLTEPYTYRYMGDSEWVYWLWVNNDHVPIMYNFCHEVDIWLLKLMNDALNSLSPKQ